MSRKQLQKMNLALFLWVATILFANSGLFAAEREQWPQFRGPSGQGISGASAPTDWSEKKNIKWKTPIHGKGWSSPVIENGVIWLTTSEAEVASEDDKKKVRETILAKSPIANQMDIHAAVRLSLVGVRASDGAKIHDMELFRVEFPEPVHQLNGYASPTPVIRDGRVYCHFGANGTACVDTTSGSVVWKTKFPLEHSVGAGSSPAIFEDLLIIPCDGMDQQFIVAIHINTGEEVWRTKRPAMTGTNGDLHKAFSTPLIIESKSGSQAIIPGSQWIVSYEPRSGKPIWQVAHDGYSVTPRPVYSDGIVYLSTGFTSPKILAIRVDGKGDVTSSHVSWTQSQQAPSMPSPLVSGDRLFMVSDQGVASCLDRKTGDMLWRNRVGGNYSASPLLAGGKIYFCNREGIVTVIDDSATYRVVATNKLDEPILASPACLDGALILRTEGHLYRIENTSP